MLICNMPTSCLTFVFIVTFLVRKDGEYVVGESVDDLTMMIMTWTCCKWAVKERLDTVRNGGRIVEERGRGKG